MVRISGRGVMIGLPQDPLFQQRIDQAEYQPDQAKWNNPGNEAFGLG